MVEIGIIAAMDKEAKPLIEQMTDTVTETISDITFTKGALCGHSVVVAVCGIGKVFAAMCAQTMILRYAPSCVINTGVAGSLTTALKIGDLAIATQVVQHDMDTSALGDPKGLISGINEVYLPTDPALTALLSDCAEDLGINAVLGVIASGDRFVSDDNYKAFITETFDGIACEMEGAAIGQVCFVNKVPFGILRAISDDASGEAQMDYPQFVEMAEKQSVKLLCYMAERT